MSGHLKWIGEVPPGEATYEYCARLLRSRSDDYVDISVTVPLDEPADVLIYDGIVYRHIGSDPPCVSYLEASAAFVLPDAS